MKRKIVLSAFKCKYTPYPFLPFIGRKECVFKIKENNIIIHFNKAGHLRHFFRLKDIQKVLLIGESIIIKYKVSEEHLGKYHIKNFSYDFVNLQSAINIFNTLCNKLNQEHISSRNYIIY